MKEIRKKLTYANVMSSLAVFLVLGGATAVAAGHLGKNSVGTKQLKPGAVTAAKIRSQAVTGTTIQDGSVTGSDIGGEAVTGAKIQDGSVTGTKIQDGSVTGSDIAKNSITGAQVDTDSLPQVPVADRTADEFTMTLALNTSEPVTVPVSAGFLATAVCSDGNSADSAVLNVRSDLEGAFFSDEGGDVPTQQFPRFPQALALAPINLPASTSGHPLTVNTHKGPLITMLVPAGTVMAIEDITVSINVGPDRDCVFSGKIRQLS